MLTRRGWAFVGVGAFGVLMSLSFGPRTLNAVVAPILVALGVGYVQLKRTGYPQLDVIGPQYGFRGDEATVRLEFSAPDPFAGTVSVETDKGLRGTGDPVSTTVGDTAVEFDVRLAERGERHVGPVEVVAEDVFGLFRRTFVYRITETILVFPRVKPVDGVGVVSTLEDRLGVTARDEFDRLREYERGDPLRDVHWKSSAKRADGDLLVREFESDVERSHVEIAAEADAGRVDDVADAAASIGTALLETGCSVGLTVPEGRTDSAAGDDQRARMLTLLAHMDSGRVYESDRSRASIVVTGSTGHRDALVHIGDRTIPFDEFASGGSSADESTVRSTPSVRADGVGAEGGGDP